ncbi:polygalacturonase [Diabrotica virgifera virgifera]|uniref:Glycoside hydrolase family 28 n=1 Tax=Diabrotica virgifera virgifera TaxID=50390 RepID=A0A088BZ29_DIAVI|nr:polygalacturonase [Diabrotica virgifera virgifera]AHJ09932.1 glycoside hydrolase family 28 [Diabrotica virgifera virgifera]
MIKTGMSLVLFFLGVVLAQEYDCEINSIDQVLPVIEKCSVITVKNLWVPSGQTLELSLKDNSHLIFDGNVTVGVKYQDEVPLIRISGANLFIEGRKDAVINGQGEKYWDGKGIEGKNRKPVLLEISAQESLLKNINIRNCPQKCVNILKSANSSFTGWNIDITDGFKDNVGLDTHGFAVANSSDIIIKESNIINQGDCIVVNQGSDLHFEQIVCRGSQGITVRPEWEYENYIRDVIFDDCTVIEGQTGIRVVTSPHQPEGYISNVIYRKIHLTGILFRGIDIRQDLDDEGRPSGNVKITELDISDVKGNMTDKYVRSVYIWCGPDGCANWNWSDIDIENAEVENACNFLPNNWSCW